MSGKAVISKTGHATASVGDTIIAETDAWEEVEGNVYFPPSTVKRTYLSETDHSTFCPWKGHASYYTIDVDGSKLDNAAWYYPQAYEKAAGIENYVAFYKSKVKVVVD
ncbi:hypothetical protein HJFPF1_00575 [Paramyrothecium foliicola]|nr:hypothetical protein HJFPF1_00575 [Paramyrothecium foliicola]